MSSRTTFNRVTSAVQDNSDVIEQLRSELGTAYTQIEVLLDAVAESKANEERAVANAHFARSAASEGVKSAGEEMVAALREASAMREELVALQDKFTSCTEAYHSVVIERDVAFGELATARGQVERLSHEIESLKSTAAADNSTLAAELELLRTDYTLHVEEGSAVKNDLVASRAEVIELRKEIEELRHCTDSERRAAEQARDAAIAEALEVRARSSRDAIAQGALFKETQGRCSTALADLEAARLREEALERSAVESAQQVSELSEALAAARAIVDEWHRNAGRAVNADLARAECAVAEARAAESAARIETAALRRRLASCELEVAASRAAAEASRAAARDAVAGKDALRPVLGQAVAACEEASAFIRRMRETHRALVGSLGAAQSTVEGQAWALAGARRDAAVAEASCAEAEEALAAGLAEASAIMTFRCRSPPSYTHTRTHTLAIGLAHHK